MTRPTQSIGPMAGCLQGIGVPALIRDLGQRSATGRLRIECDHVRRTVLFEDGLVKFAASTDPNDRLGEHLLRRGVITLHQLERALAAQHTGHRIGRLLVDAGALTEDQLVEVVREQSLSIVFDLLTWCKGDYQFEETPIPDEKIRLQISTEELLFRGVREVRSLNLISRGVGTPHTFLCLTDDWSKRVEALELTEGARTLIDRLIGGPASIDTLCREVPLSNFELFQTLWAFRLIGVTDCCRPAEQGGHEGRLATTGLAEVLLRLANDVETGVLYLSHGAVERSLLFAAGRCVFATSNDPDDSLVQFLFRRGTISLRDKEETLRRLLTNKRVGAILRELGAIDDDDLQSMVRQQVSEIVHDSFTWSDGAFVFVPGPLPHAEEITLDCSVGLLVTEGIRRVNSWTRLVQGCGGVDNPLCLTPSYLEILDDIGSGVAEWEVVNALKSPQTPRRVCALTELGDFRVCQILWTLKLLGAIEDSPVDIEEAVDEESGVPPTTGETARETEEETPELEIIPTAVVRAEPPDAKADGAQAPVGEPTPFPHADDERTFPADRDLPVDGSAARPSLTDAGRDGVTVTRAEDVGGGQEQAESPDPDLPEGIRAAINQFNAMHRVIYRAVRTEVGAGAANFVRSCCVEVARETPDLIEGVLLRPDGTWEVEGLQQVIVKKGVEDPWPGYQRILDREFLALKSHLNDARADQLRQEILEIEQLERS